MKLSIQSHSLIESTLKEALEKFSSKERQAIITDVHLMPKQGTGELYIFDDDDEELAKTIIAEWVDYDKDDFYQNVEHILQALLTKIREQGIMENLTILKPYSFVMVDEEHETVAELLLIDDDTILVSEELLKGLDEELDAFLKELLEK